MGVTATKRHVDVVASDDTFRRVRLDLTFADFMSECREEGFGSWFSKVLADMPFTDFFWECPPITRACVSRPFEFTVVRARGFRAASPQAFARHFDDRAAVSFKNIGGDAVLVAPTPRDYQYGHIAAFCRQAPPDVQDDFWREVATALDNELEARGDDPTWLSTAGTGVPWLHVRLDSFPKYYHTQDYKIFKD